MRRLIWGFAGRTYHIVGNLMHWLKYNFQMNLKYKTVLDMFYTYTIDFMFVNNVPIWHFKAKQINCLS